MPLVAHPTTSTHKTINGINTILNLEPEMPQIWKFYLLYLLVLLETIIYMDLRSAGII